MQTAWGEATSLRGASQANEWVVLWEWENKANGAKKNGYMPGISICYIAVVVCVVVLKPLCFLWFGPVFGGVGSDIWAWRI